MRNGSSCSQFGETRRPRLMSPARCQASAAPATASPISSQPHLGRIFLRSTRSLAVAAVPRPVDH
jgi:hypothetical protein